MYIAFHTNFHEEETVSDMAPGPLTPLSGMSFPLIHSIAWTWTTHEGFIRLMVPHEHPEPSLQTEGRAAPGVASPRTASGEHALLYRWENKPTGS